MGRRAVQCERSGEGSLADNLWVLALHNRWCTAVGTACADLQVALRQTYKNSRNLRMKTKNWDESLMRCDTAKRLHDTRLQPFIYIHYMGNAFLQKCEPSVGPKIQFLYCIKLITVNWMSLVWIVGVSHSVSTLQIVSELKLLTILWYFWIKHLDLWTSIVFQELLSNSRTYWLEVNEKACTGGPEVWHLTADFAVIGTELNNQTAEKLAKVSNTSPRLEQRPSSSKLAE